MKETLRDLRLKEKREALNLTQKQVADMVGIPYQAYQRYETGKIIPNAVLAVRISRALKTTVEELYGE